MVGLASVFGSFALYGVHLACGPSLGLPSPVASGHADGPSASSSVAGAGSTSATNGVSSTNSGSSGAGSCGCNGGTTTASFAVGGDEKMTFDPLDASADLSVAYIRAPGGKKVVEVTAVVRAYRSDQAAERPTTISVRVLAPETGGAVVAKDVEAFLTSYGSTTNLPPKAFATVSKSALSVVIADGAVELRGSLSLTDVPTKKTVVVDKLTVRKSGASVLPVRNGAFKSP